MRVHVWRLERIVGPTNLQLGVGMINNIILIGDEEGNYSEIYTSEITYYGKNCTAPMFAVSQK